MAASSAAAAAARRRGGAAANSARARAPPLPARPVMMTAYLRQGSGAVLSTLLSVAVVLSGCCAAQAQAQQAQPIAVLEGAARVVDGDTLYVNNEKVRLYAVDAPESKQTCKDAAGKSYACGEQSAAALRAKIGQRPVRCAVKTKDQYGRNVASCTVVGGTGSGSGSGSTAPEDVGAYLVANGQAVAYRSISRAYAPLEDKAKQQRKGMWAGAFVEPAQWRRENKAGELGDSFGTPASALQAQQQPQQQQQAAPRPAPAPVTPGKSFASALGGGGGGGSSSLAIQPPPPQQQQPKAPASSSGSAPPQQPSSGCAIKGNINAKGERIFHVPGGADYDRTLIDKPGERWFCSKAEAEAAGWRAAGARK